MRNSKSRLQMAFKAGLGASRNFSLFEGAKGRPLFLAGKRITVRKGYFSGVFIVLEFPDRAKLICE
ncbi:hypothetical protein NPIL_554471, partial [Nephila pilipes]